MNTVKSFLAGCMVAVAICSIALADAVVVGNSDGELFTRMELDLATPQPNGWVGFGTLEWIQCLASGIEGDLAIGTGYGAGHVRKYYDLPTIFSSANFTYAADAGVSAIATRPDGHVVLGTEEFQVFVRDRSDLALRPPGYPPYADGLNFNNAVISALACLSTGDVIIGNANGEIFVRSGSDLTVTAPGAAVDSINFTIPVTALAVTPTDEVVIGLEDGTVDVRAWNDIATSLTNVNFGIKITALAALSNGNVVIGLNDGQVHVRDTTDLLVPVTSAVFTEGDPINALAVTSHDNVVIGAGNGWVFVRRGDDLGLTPDGFQGPDGVFFNAPVTAVATFALAEPTTCAEAISQGYGIASDLDDDCYVNWSDFSVFASHWLETDCADPDWCNGADLDQDTFVNWSDFSVFAQDWLRCVDPQDPNCEHPW